MTTDPYLPSSGRPRICGDCGGPVLLQRDGSLVDDGVDRGEPHAPVCELRQEFGAWRAKNVLAQGRKAKKARARR